MTTHFTSCIKNAEYFINTGGIHFRNTRVIKQLEIELSASNYTLFPVLFLVVTGVDDQVICLWAAKYSRDKGLNVTKILSHYRGFGARKSLVNASVLSTVREIMILV